MPDRSDDHGLSSAWDRALSLAWASFRAGTTPVGAVVVDGSGTIVAQGRGRRYDEGPPSGELAGCDVAHAELNALAHLPVGGRWQEHCLLTSLEPCAMCRGAAIQARLGSVRYAAPDPYAGTAHVEVDTEQARRRGLRVLGPLRDHRGALAAILHLVWLASMGRADHVVDVHRSAMPAMTGYAAEVAREVHDAAACDAFDAVVRLARAAPLAELT